MKNKIKSLISDKRIIISIYILFAVVASLQSLRGTKVFVDGGLVYTKHNNYTIFEKSFEHLKNNQDLYILYPEEHWDLFKYTPTFSVFFGIFYVLPDWLGIILWNVLNVLVLLFAIYFLPKFNAYQKGLIAVIILIELMTSMQSQQSNALMAGLLVFSFGQLEKKQIFWATFCLVCSVFIKLFGIVGFVLLLFYPNKIKAAAYTIFWIFVFLIIPLLFVDIEQYINLFKSYGFMLTNDHDNSLGYSVMGLLNTIFSIEINKLLIVSLGAILLLAPFYKLHKYKDYTFKYLVTCSILIWIIIFNHKAESPTFIIAMTGVALWFIDSKKNTLNIFLFTFAFILTSLSPTDIFPKMLRDEFVHPYALKALPCVLIWFKISYDLLTAKKEKVVLKQSS